MVFEGSGSHINFAGLKQIKLLNAQTLKIGEGDKAGKKNFISGFPTWLNVEDVGSQPSTSKCSNSGPSLKANHGFQSVLLLDFPYLIFPSTCPMLSQESQPPRGTMGVCITSLP